MIMADFKYGKFVIGTVIKLVMYLALCFAVRIICMRHAPMPWNYIIPPAAAAVITWVFLTYAEGGKRSFFAKGYMVENIVPGAAVGIAAFGVTAAIEWVMGNLKIIGFIPGFDPRFPLYEVFGFMLFAGIVIFGYFFHIIQHDFGIIPAVLLSAIVYCFEGRHEMPLYTILLDISGYSSRVYVVIVNLLLTAIIAGMAIVYFGDMRSGTAFLCFLGFLENASYEFVKVEYCGKSIIGPDFLYPSLMFTIVMIVIIVWLFAEIRKQQNS